jgi:hypothetical protein
MVPGSTANATIDGGAGFGASGASTIGAGGGATATFFWQPTAAVRRTTPIAPAATAQVFFIGFSRN